MFHLPVQSRWEVLCNDFVYSIQIHQLSSHNHEVLLHPCQYNYTGTTMSFIHTIPGTVSVSTVFKSDVNLKKGQSVFSIVAHRNINSNPKLFTLKLFTFTQS